MDARAGPIPSPARMHLSTLIIGKQEHVINEIVPHVPILRLGMMTNAKPEPHYEQLFRDELTLLVNSEPWRNRMAALCVNGEALAWWAMKRDGVPIVVGYNSLSHFAADFAEPRLYDPQSAVAHWKETIPLTDGEAEKLLSNLKDLRQATTNAGEEYSTAVMDSISTLFAKAVKEGLSLSEFRRQFVQDIPGKARNVIEQIYRTNLTKFYAEERLTTIRGAGIRAPFIQYITIPDDRRTAICRAMDGYIAASADDTWNVWVPPNHYQCRSDLSPIPYLEAIRRGLAQYTSDRKGLILVRGPRPYGDPPRWTTDSKTHKQIPVIPQAGFGRGEKFGLAA